MFQLARMQLCALISGNALSFNYVHLGFNISTPIPSYLVFFVLLHFVILILVLQLVLSVSLHGIQLENPQISMTWPAYIKMFFKIQLDSFSYLQLSPPELFGLTCWPKHNKEGLYSPSLNLVSTLKLNKFHLQLDSSLHC